jgi:hypothetical protein
MAFSQPIGTPVLRISVYRDVDNSDFLFPIRHLRRFERRRVFGRPPASKRQNGNPQGAPLIEANSDADFQKSQISRLFFVQK